jgi:aerobic carbon-monoxide dehydrogenase small subunit
VKVAIDVNGRRYEANVEPRLSLADFIRDEARLRGTHLGCEHGVCGACTVQLDEEPVRSCLLLAVQANGRRVRTVEALGQPGALDVLQEAFRDAHALQCGFCTSGFLLSLEPFLRDHREPSDEEIREALAGNLCRCTGYVGIVEAVRLAAERLHGD